MKTEEAKKNIQETLSKLESFNRDSDPVFSSLLQVLSSLIIVIISAFETLQTSFNHRAMREITRDGDSRRLGQVAHGSIKSRRLEKKKLLAAIVNGLFSV